MTSLQASGSLRPVAAASCARRRKFSPLHQKALSRWKKSLASIREAVFVLVGSAAVWWLLEATGIGVRLFGWITSNPSYPGSSFLVTVVLQSLGVALYAICRYTDLWVATRSAISESIAARALSVEDSLTGLNNRRAFLERLQQAQDLRDVPVGVALIDLDRFKFVNDQHGHAAGDRLLQAAADRLRNELLHNQAVYRLGGDEFACLVFGPNAAQRAEDLAWRCIEALHKPFHDGALVFAIGATAGVAGFPEDGDEPMALVRLADRALYEAKEAGRGMCRRYDSDLGESAERRELLEGSFCASMHAGEISACFQPIFDLTSHKVVGYEVLARWKSPLLGDVPPREFIPIAEETGLINEMMLMLVNQACEAACAWEGGAFVSVNFSPVQLRDPWLAQKLLGVLTMHGISPHRFVIEITERALIELPDAALQAMDSLGQIGVRFCLDDFGSGFSSLHHLRTFPFTAVKIDARFMFELDTNASTRSYVSTIVGIAKTFSLQVVAEGIESGAVASALREIGCSHGQGYFLGRPVAAQVLGHHRAGDDGSSLVCGSVSLIGRA